MIDLSALALRAKDPASSYRAADIFFWVFYFLLFAFVLSGWELLYLYTACAVFGCGAIAHLNGLALQMRRVLELEEKLLTKGEIK